MTPDLTAILTRWATDEGRPFKGQLIDMQAYKADPESLSCFCAQGQVLHLIGGWDADRLMTTTQDEADNATAKLLGISSTHAVLMRNINDSIDGAPAIVLTHPERVLGDQAQTVLAFWRYLDRMTQVQWTVARKAARAAAGAAVAWDAAWAASWDAARAASWGNAAENAAGGNAAENAAWATHEIQGAAVMRAKGHAFHFLPLFGFADPEAVLAGDVA